MQQYFCLPSMESSGHELCFISHPKYKCRVSCDVFGKLRMYKTWKGWEVWRFVKEKSGNFTIASWTHDQKILCSDSKGGVYTKNKKTLVEKEELVLGEWMISINPDKHYGVRIQSVKHGRFLAFSGKQLYTMKKEEDTIWHLDPAHRGQFFISSLCHDRRLSSTKEGKLSTFRNRKPWERWLIEPTKGNVGQFSICSVNHGKYLGLSKDGNLISSSSKQHWKIVPSRHGGVFIQSVQHGGWLSCDDKGCPLISKADAIWETWQLEPIMPATISGKQIWSLVGIGVTTVSLAVAAPFAVMGAVGAVGFGAEGIAAGSMAVGMMSAEAIAGGGVVAAGGLVASLQSIGAAGLGVAGVSAAATAGAAVGGLSSLGVVAASKGLDHGCDENKLEEPEKNLPLCSWRMCK